MKRLIIGLFIGMVVMGILVLGPLSPTPANGQAGEPENFLFQTQTKITEAFRDSLIAPLQKAGEEISDNDTQQFYQLLMSEYRLDETPVTVSDAEEFSLSELIPDIKHINRTALSLPLSEAGKNIKDKEIARFYYDLLKRSGWEITPD
ncbi:MAG: hypothetical protein V3R96_07090 [Dehalococcoidales bacterium]